VFPHAGGTALSYRPWAATLPAGLDFLALQLPGRQQRLAEKPFERLQPLVTELLEQFEATLDGRPYALLGHSFGAMLAYRLTVELERAGVPGPEVLVVSGWVPEPVSAALLAEAPGLDDEELLDRVSEFGLVPAHLRADRELLAMVLPALRADLTVAADYADDGTVVDCPVLVCTGTDDPLLGSADPAAWRERTRRFLGVNRYSGGHFYIFDHAAAMQSDIERWLPR
jgi:surfactin synthase thioesterase subunit